MVGLRIGFDGGRPGRAVAQRQERREVLPRNRTWNLAVDRPLLSPESGVAAAGAGSAAAGARRGGTIRSKSRRKGRRKLIPGSDLDYGKIVTRPPL